MESTESIFVCPKRYGSSPSHFDIRPDKTEAFTTIVSLLLHPECFFGGKTVEKNKSIMMKLVCFFFNFFEIVALKLHQECFFGGKTVEKPKL